MPRRRRSESRPRMDSAPNLGFTCILISLTCPIGWKLLRLTNPVVTPALASWSGQTAHTSKVLTFAANPPSTSESPTTFTGGSAVTVLGSGFTNPCSDPITIQYAAAAIESAS